MREGSSLHDKMLDRNWALKRKRKQISSGLDVTTGKEGVSMLSEFTKKNSSFRKKFRGVTDGSQCSQKIKGQDGYYFECEQCDLGGNLLCCDNCPRTYHLECLNPPLKRAPAGKWLCPNCCNKKDDKINSEETSSRRARAKTTNKALAMHKIFNSDKTSYSVSSFQGNSKSTAKVKAASVKKSFNSLNADISAKVRTSLSEDDVLKEGVSTTAVCKLKKKSVMAPRRKRSAQQMVHSLVKSLNPHPSDKSTKKKPDLYKNESQGKKLDIPLIVSAQLPEKRREKINQIYKRKSSERLSSESSLKQETNFLKFSGLKEPEISPQEASFLSYGLGKNSDKTITFHEDFFHGIQEVHRILGCRVQTESSCINQTFGIINSKEEKNAENSRLQNEFSTCDLTSQENFDQVDCFDSSKVVDVNLRQAMDEDFRGDANLIFQKIGGSSILSEKNITDKTFETSENIDIPEGLLTLLCQPSHNHCIADKELQLGDDSAGDANVGELTAKKCDIESMHVEPICAQNHIESHTLRSAEFPGSCDSEDAHTAIRSKLDCSYEDCVVPKESAQELRPKDSDFVTYEFFVKWVGKSNIHNSWVSEDKLKVLAKRKLENYKAKYGVSTINICQEQWCQPQRLISIHESENGGVALVKWLGLPYDECTWERLDESVIKNSSHLLSELKQFESQTFYKDYSDDIVKAVIREVVPLVEQPKELKGGSLFLHQLEALNWLRKSWHKSKNVILADEMGLGKTVSACSFISSLYFEFKVKLPCLVLVPLSTMPNWLAEFVSWTPHLNVVEYHGSAKARSVIRQYEWHASDAKSPSKLSKAYKFNVLLTTYEMILADSSHLRGVPWEVLIVDEGHRLKNSESKLFNLLNTFSFKQRVLLTGTPLQNNLGEMYNLLNFLQPCSFPSLLSFEEKFYDLSTAEKVEELKKLVAPHMLRRLKKDAMQNIPPKTERMVPVELTSIQAEYYRAMLTKNYQILRNIGKGVAQQSMLNIVMQLRKVCNHPYLIPGTEPESSSLEFLQEMRIKASAKLTLLHSMLKILHKEGHRVLLFSQMTKLLDILEDYLTIEYGLGTFERVDGSVSVADRQAAIARFNQDKSRFVFLLSTRSCGLGINLATADTVIIYDSDFNPHADIQAMNRAHRIGQSNRLLVYRLVVRASVEERILQLAKKKLMLDQLFVNKSGSQKEVEDILRWGTEELFSDSDGGNYLDVKKESNNIVDAAADGEHKHRRRTGGLGDVYKDRCTDGGTKIVWDENAILKLLDRSDLQSGISENIDGDLENDMLGSIKSLDWNEETINEEPGNNEILTNLAGDGREPSPEGKEDNANTLMEQNEWDKLLRVRWEKYQVEEEAALGRGKRLRKAISYKETFTSIPHEPLNESGNEEEEPKREYTPAGQALKEKFLMLRVRQKKRIAIRHVTDIHSPVERPELFLVKGYQDSDTNKEDVHFSVNSEEAKCSQPLGSMCSSNSNVQNGRALKNGHKRYISYLDLSVSTPENLSNVNSPSNHFPKKCLATSVPSSSLLPVLGLCAPNASQRNSTSRTFRTPTSKQTLHHEQKRSDIGLPEILSSTAEVSQGTDPPTLLDTPDEAFNPHLKNIIPDNNFPFGYPPLPTLGSCPSDLGESSGTTFPTFHEKLGLPKLDLDDKFPMKFSFPPQSLFKQQTNFLPSLSLSANMELANSYNPNLSNIPLMPDFSPVLGLSTVHTSQTLPDNHKKVLDNIMMRTHAHKFWKKKPKVVAWSEDELDALWIGVRRHGRGNWDAMFRDPKLKILKHRSFEELSSKWNEEQCKIIDGPAPFPKIPKIASGLSSSMMAQTLLGIKFSDIGQEPSRSHSHLTDIKLTCGDLLPKFPLLERFNQLAGSSYIEDLSAGMLNRLEKVSLPSDQFVPHTSLPGCFLGVPGIISPNLPHGAQNIHSGEYQKRQDCSKYSVVDDAPGSSKVNKLPHWLRKAVSGPSNFTESVLSPSVSAIRHSVRVLYGEDKSTIPPFDIPGPLPFLPKDPRKSMRKRRKLGRLWRAFPDIYSESSRTEPSASSQSAIPSLTASIQSSVPLVERNLSPPLSSLNLNLNSPSMQSWEMPVLPIVSSHAMETMSAPDVPTPTPTFSYEKSELPASKDPESSQQFEGDLLRDFKCLDTKQKAATNSDLDYEKLDDVRVDWRESGDSSNAKSDSLGGFDVKQVLEHSTEAVFSDENK